MDDDFMGDDDFTSDDDLDVYAKELIKDPDAVSSIARKISSEKELGRLVHKLWDNANLPEKYDLQLMQKPVAQKIVYIVMRLQEEWIKLQSGTPNTEKQQ
jgi:hypothetical protein